MEPQQPAARPDKPTGRGVTGVGLGSLISAIAVYVVLLIASRTLPTAANTELLTWLAAFQLATGLLTGLSTELTRSVASASGAPEGPSVLKVGATVGLAAGGVLALTALWWAPLLLGSADLLAAGFLCLGIVGFACHSAMSGGFSGTSDWPGLARLLLLEAILKLCLVGVVALVGATVAGFAGAIAGAAFAWTILALTAPGRRALAARTDRRPRELAPRLFSAVGAQGASALLTVGFPLLLAATTPRPEYAESAPLLLAISLTRAPLLIPLGAFQSMAITQFVHTTRHRGVLLLQLAMLLLGVGALGALAAWLIGPWLMKVLFTYEIGGMLLAGLTLAAAALALLTLIGALCQASDRHAWFLGGWIVAVVTSLACLLTPFGMETRTLLALLAGPLVGAALMSGGLLLASGHRRDGVPPAPPRNAAA